VLLPSPLALLMNADTFFFFVGSSAVLRVYLPRVSNSEPISKFSPLFFESSPFDAC